MGSPVASSNGDHSGKRVRTSESALRIALKVAKDEGMVVDKLCVSGGYIEVHIRGVEAAEHSEKDSGLEKW